MNVIQSSLSIMFRFWMKWSCKSNLRAQNFCLEIMQKRQKFVFDFWAHCKNKSSFDLSVLEIGEGALISTFTFRSLCLRIGTVLTLKATCYMYTFTIHFKAQNNCIVMMDWNMQRYTSAYGVVLSAKLVFVRSFITYQSIVPFLATEF